MEDYNFGTANFVSKLDLRKGYWQVPLTQRASQHTVMAFGMRNAPATCNAYLDVLIVYTTTWKEHIQTGIDVR